MNITENVIENTIDDIGVVIKNMIKNGDTENIKIRERHRGAESVLMMLVSKKDGTSKNSFTVDDIDVETSTSYSHTHYDVDDKVREIIHGRDHGRWVFLNFTVNAFIARDNEIRSIKCMIVMDSDSFRTFLIDNDIF